MLTNLVNSLRVPFLVIDNGSTPPILNALREPTKPVNLSKLWNLGIQYTVGDYIAILNDDLTISQGSLESLAEKLDHSPASVAYPGPVERLYTGPQLANHYERMPGYCFVLRRASDIKADENLRWWCGDNDIDMQARQRGGALSVAGLEIQNLKANEHMQDIELRNQAGRDIEYFESKWGFRPV